MTWCAYQVVLRLRSPLHIGCGQVGNLQRTCPYVTGRVLWGALTMRLTRDAVQGRGPATDSLEYREMGDQVHQSLAFTYFYPALKSGNDYRVVWPWENENFFRRRFLSSHQGTALSYPQQSAAEGMLHEVEFICPNTLDTGEMVFLKGYVFEKEGCTLGWQSALKRLQMGGERGYGWGDIELADIRGVDELLFGGPAKFQANGDVPVIRVPPEGRLLAHTLPTRLQAQGEVEPLVGREWRSDSPRNRHVGQHVEFCGLCFAPGSKVMAQCETPFRIDRFGVWAAIQ